MSTLTVTNIKATGETASRAVSGVAAAWVSFIAAGSVSIRNSLNTSSIDDNGTGNFRVNFSTSFATNDYVPSCTTWQSNFTTDVNENFPLPQTSYQDLTTLENNSNTDPNHINISFHGDLA